ncbi:MAG: transposase [Xenococcaceae cyanobacterium MO_167.B27]|nr:transposase [Xenococcaceae cyanobacterium MO_167.B27]
MIVLEFKLKGKQHQYKAIDEAIRTAQFIRNKCVRFWMDNSKVSRADLSKYTKQLAKEYWFASKLNAMSRQASAERAWSSIARFYDNCKKKVPGKKGYPRFKKNSRSVEFKTQCWKLLDPKHIQFTDKNNIGKFKLVGTWDLAFYDEKQIKRVRLIRRADGYYCQFCVSVDVQIDTLPTKKAVGLDVGLEYFYSDSNKHQEPNPRFYRTGEKQLNRLNRQKSKKFRKGQPQTNNYKKALNRYARKHLKVSRQRKEHAKRLALRLIQSNDLIAYEDLRIANMVKIGKLSKSINDAGWYQFRTWLEYFASKYGKIAIPVPAAYSSQECTKCGRLVKKTLSTRTHQCTCGHQEHRDIESAIIILQRGLRRAGHALTHAWGETSSSSVGENLLGYGDSLNQESGL